MEDVCLPFGVAILLIVAIVVAPIFIVAGVSAARRKRFQKEILRTKAHILKQGRWFPVRYASEKRFKRWLKFFPWQTSGIIFVGDREWIFFARRLEGQRNAELRFDPRAVTLKWVGTEDWFRNGLTSWFLIEADSGRH